MPLPIELKSTLTSSTFWGEPQDEQVKQLAKVYPKFASAPPQAQIEFLGMARGRAKKAGIFMPDQGKPGGPPPPSLSAAPMSNAGQPDTKPPETALHRLTKFATTPISEQAFGPGATLAGGVEKMAGAQRAGEKKEIDALGKNHPTLAKAADAASKADEFAEGVIMGTPAGLVDSAQTPLGIATMAAGPIVSKIAGTSSKLAAVMPRLVPILKAAGKLAGGGQIFLGGSELINSKNPEEAGKAVGDVAAGGALLGALKEEKPPKSAPAAEATPEPPSAPAKASSPELAAPSSETRQIAAPENLTKRPITEYTKNGVPPERVEAMARWPIDKQKSHLKFINTVLEEAQDPSRSESLRSGTRQANSPDYTVQQKQKMAQDRDVLKMLIEDAGPKPVRSKVSEPAIGTTKEPPETVHAVGGKVRRSPQQIAAAGKETQALPPGGSSETATAGATPAHVVSAARANQIGQKFHIDPDHVVQASWMSDDDLIGAIKELRGVKTQITQKSWKAGTNMPANYAKDLDDHIVALTTLLFDRTPAPTPMPPGGAK